MRRAPSKPPTVIDVVREQIRLRHYSLRTEKAYIGWIRRYITFCGRRHPRMLGAVEITSFLTHLAVDRKVSASTQNQALQASLFLYRNVLQMDLPDIGQVVRASRPARLPTVLTREEVQRVFAHLEGPVATRRGSAVRQWPAVERSTDAARTGARSLTP